MRLDKNIIIKSACLIALGGSLAACDALQITGGPIEMGAAQAGNLLDHGNFNGGFGRWRACSHPSAITLDSNDINTEGTAHFTAGGCLFQAVAAKANDEMVVSCSASKDENSFASMSFGYLDENFEPLEHVETEITGSSIMNEVSAALRAPTGTVYAEVLLYAASGAVVDDCELINLREGMPQEFLINAYFEEGLDGWQTCEGTSTSVENDTATITAGCITQTFTAYEGVTLHLTCNGMKTGDEHTAVALGYLDRDNQPLTHSETAFDDVSGTQPSVTVTGPENAFYAQAMVYTEGEVNLDSCAMQMVEAQ